MSKSANFVIDVTLEQFNTLMGKAKAAGMGPEALEGGTLPEEEGCVLAYKVGVEANNMIPITFTVIKKPWMVSTAFVESKVRQKIQQA